MKALSLIWRGARAFGRGIGVAGRATVALVGICGVVAAVANYAMTQGAGTNFGSVVVGGIHYAQMFLCDLTTPGQCAAVDGSGNVSVKDAEVLAAVQAAIPPQNPAVPVGGVSICDGANGTTNPCTTPVTVKAASTPAAATDKAIVVDQRPGTTVPVAPNAYPTGATPITASAIGTTGATTATLAGTSGKTTYICGYSIRANATAATTVTNTITGVITATLSSIMWIAPLPSGIGVDEQIFSPCIPASGTNQAIAVVSGAPGSGGAVSSKGWGYQQ